MSNDTLLKIEDLKIEFHTEDRIVNAVKGISFEIPKGKTIGLVGESGSGKSVTSLSVMRLLPEPPAKIPSGKILFQGENLLEKTEEQMRRIRGNKVSMIFQEPIDRKSVV